MRVVLQVKIPRRLPAIPRTIQHSYLRLAIALRRYFSLGRRGERVAARTLKRRGYFIREQNWRCDFGEIDIIAQERRTLVFIEVKTRRAEIASDFTPVDAVGAAKQRRLKRLAERYYQDHLRDIKYKRLFRTRFDVVGVTQSSALRYRTKIYKDVF